MLKHDREWEKCLRVAALAQTGYQLRRLFAKLLAFCNVSDPARLWTLFRDELSDDLLPRVRDAIDVNQVQDFANRRANSALAHIQELLRRMGRDLIDFQDMPVPDDNEPARNRLIDEELSYPIFAPEEIANMEQLLNNEQRNAYTTIKDAYITNTSAAFFIDGPAGTGKTFLYSLILAMIRSNHDIALAVAGSGIAALLLQGGRTAHSRFKIPIPTLEDSTCNIRHNTDLAALLIRAKVIVWDEAPASHRYLFETVDRTLKDLMKLVDPDNEYKPFGGKTMVFGGDFRQIPPVIKSGRREDTIAACLKRSSLWQHIQHIRLSVNMRLFR